MPGSMKKTNPTALPHFGGKSAFSEKLLDRLVDRGAVDAGFDGTKTQCLAGFDRLPHFALSIGRASPHNRARQIAEISGLPVPRKHVKDDKRICLQRT